VPSLSELNKINPNRLKFWQTKLDEEYNQTVLDKSEILHSRNHLVMADEKTVKAFKEVPENIIYDLYEIYKYDFILFGYDVSQFISL
jgi:hypothetical protein